MKCLEFERIGLVQGNRIVRRARFIERSLLPVSAACVVANGIRETLAAALQTRVDARVFAPVIPQERAWSVLLQEALALRVRGNVGEAAMFVRPDDARALACATFGEPPNDRHVLSAIEREVVQRLLQRLSSTLSSVCGSPVETMTTLFEHARETMPYATYFEVVIDRPMTASLGVALVCDPFPQPHGAIAVEDVHGIELPLHARLRAGTLSAARACELRPGDVLSLDGEARTELCYRRRTIAHGKCGASENRYALAIREVAA